MAIERTLASVLIFLSIKWLVRHAVKDLLGVSLGCL